jgi:uncharacterized protein YqgC (DUF456 family)
MHILKPLPTMDIILLILSGILLLTGIIGSILPALPGLPLSWLGIVCFSCLPQIPFSTIAVITSAFIVIIISTLDYLLPSITTKKYGGSRYGIWGTNIGLIIGIFTPIPFGFFIGPFLGAFIGEFIFNKSKHTTSFKAASGAFIGFIASTFMKFIISVVFLAWWIVLLWQNKSLLF